MNIEILEFYLHEVNESKGLLNGSLKVKLVDLGIILMGVLISKRKGVYFFTPPGRFCDSHETGEKIRFPYVVFENPERQRALINAIREKGITFIEALLSDPERSLNFPPQKIRPMPDQLKPINVSNQASTDIKLKEEPLKMVEPKAHEPIPKPVKKIAEFVDPPRRKSAFARTNPKGSRR